MINLLQEVWGYRGGVATRTVDTHVLTVRKKLRDNIQEPIFIQTLHGVGISSSPNPYLNVVYFILTARAEDAQLWFQLQQARYLMMETEDLESSIDILNGIIAQSEPDDFIVAQAEYWKGTGTV